MYRYNYRYNMGPRGRKFGHRGFRPEIFLGILGLMFFGWIILAVIGGVLGAGIMILGSVVSGLARLAAEPLLLGRHVNYAFLGEIVVDLLGEAHAVAVPVAADHPFGRESAALV